MSTIILLILLVFMGPIITAEIEFSNKVLTNPGDVYVHKELHSDTLNIIRPFSSFTCESLTGKKLAVKKGRTASTKIGTANIKHIYPLTGDAIKVNGMLDITGGVEYSLESDPSTKPDTKTATTSFFQTKSLIINGVKQWTLIESENFDSGNSSYLQKNGWKIRDTSKKMFTFLKSPQLEKAENNDLMIGGATNEEITKVLENLPEHKHLKIEANFHFLTPIWNGQAAFIKVDGRMVWVDHHDWKDYGINACENNDPEAIKDNMWSTPINVVINHDGPSAEIIFGTTVQKPVKNSDCLAKVLAVLDMRKSPVMGLDDIHIYSK